MIPVPYVPSDATDYFVRTVLGLYIVLVVRPRRARNWIWKFRIGARTKGD